MWGEGVRCNRLVMSTGELHWTHSTMLLGRRILEKSSAVMMPGGKQGDNLGSGVSRHS